MFDRSGYDGPPAWWTARQERRLARRPCDEYGTPREDDFEEEEEESPEEEEEESPEEATARAEAAEAHWASVLAFLRSRKLIR
jgi:hypothetical protein